MALFVVIGHEIDAPAQGRSLDAKLDCVEEWSVPTDIAFDEAHKAKALFPDCDEQTFQSWTANGWNSDRFQQGPGQVDRLWILDVNGERLVVDAYYLLETSEEDRAELEEVVQSIRFLD